MGSIFPYLVPVAGIRRDTVSRINKGGNGVVVSVNPTNGNKMGHTQQQHKLK